MDRRLDPLPGGDLVQHGIEDLAHGVESIPALLVSIGADRLRHAGLTVPGPVFPSPERRLYDRLASDDSDSAHSRYNALIRRLVSCERALECGVRGGQPAVTTFAVGDGLDEIKHELPSV